MSNPSKEKGTRFETAVCRYLRDRLGQPCIERRALHGSRDMGDLFGIDAHGLAVVAECKAVARRGPSLVGEWRRQALEERENAGAGAVVLVVDVPRAPVWRSEAHVTLRDLARIARPLRVNEGRMDEADGSWVQMTLGELCTLIDDKEE